jgi:hypothetical protein
MVDRPSRRGDDDTAKAHERRRLLQRLAVVAAGVLVLLVILLLACVLWIPRWLYPPLTDTDLHGVSDAAKVQELKGARLKLENAAVLVLTGAGIGAAVTLRQIRISQGQLQATREQMQHTLETTQQQLNLTEQGQVTDRYTKAVEQLGHEKAPVRLGALYSLEHLAQDNPNYRQTVVDVVCAYLRMPYALPAQPEPVQELAPPANGSDRAVHLVPGGDPAREELQVRQTAQRLLADHLRWPGISLDLTGATLVDFSFPLVSVKWVLFAEATFQGSAWFDGATFHGNARFVEATFKGDAGFGEATFKAAGFRGATFKGIAGFDKATFQGTALFDKATFKGDAGIAEATFQGNARFARATFQGAPSFDKAHVLHLDGLDMHRVWPDGWAVVPDPTDPSRGTLVKAY